MNLSGLPRKQWNGGLPPSLPSDEGASKLIWLALRNITADWGRAAKDWKEAMNQFAILYEDRFAQPAQGAHRAGG
ncbi:hypothetical protein [Variovorax sp. 38R]|uniref:hypothetical protein n=1 Tax=Variovorax sp. 38R TaxID=2774875 RepID=UPI001CE09D47|nr:hypothetical protein [Variovorax sp. 38R]